MLFRNLPQNIQIQMTMEVLGNKYHSEPEMRLDGFEMNMGNDYYSSLVACLAYWKKLKMKKFS